jgi:hypothetical protein
MLSGVKFSHIYVATILFDTLCNLIMSSGLYSFQYLVDADFKGIWLPLLLGAFAMTAYSQFKWTIIARQSDI